MVTKICSISDLETFFPLHRIAIRRVKRFIDPNALPKNLSKMALNVCFDFHTTVEGEDFWRLVTIGDFDAAKKECPWLFTSEFSANDIPALKIVKPNEFEPGCQYIFIKDDARGYATKAGYLVGEVVTCVQYTFNEVPHFMYKGVLKSINVNKRDGAIFLHNKDFEYSSFEKVQNGSLVQDEKYTYVKHPIEEMIGKKFIYLFSKGEKNFVIGNTGENVISWFSKYDNRIVVKKASPVMNSAQKFSTLSDRNGFNKLSLFPNKMAPKKKSYLYNDAQRRHTDTIEKNRKIRF